MRHILGEVRGIDQLNHALPVRGAQSDGQLRIEARNRIARRPGVERVLQMAAGLAKFGGNLCCLLQAPGLQQIGDGIHQVVDIVPVIIDRDVLLAHVAFVGQRGSIECSLGPRVITGTVKDVARHVDHMS